MKTAFRESFDSDLSVITDAALLRRIKKVIEQVEAARTFRRFQISNGWKVPASIIASDWANIASDLFLKMARSPLFAACIARKSTATFRKTPKSPKTTLTKLATLLLHADAIEIGTAVGRGCIRVTRRARLTDDVALNSCERRLRRKIGAALEIIRSRVHTLPSHDQT